MLLSDIIIKDALAGFSPRIYLDDTSQYRFHDIQILSSNNKAFSEAVLYIGTCADVRALDPSVLSRICLVCIGSKGLKPCLSKKNFRGFLISDEYSLAEIANHLITIFGKLNAWSYQLDNAILSGDNYYSLVTFGENIFGKNPLLFVDSSYNIVACSQKSCPKNDRLNQIIQQGYYDSNTTDTFSKMGYQLNSSLYDNATLVYPPNYMGCPFMLQVFHATNGTFIGFVAVYFSDDKPTKSQFELFSMFAEKAKRHYFQNISISGELSSPLEAFMADLLHHTKDDEAYLNDRAKSLRLPLSATYRLCVIKCNEYSVQQTNYIIGRLKTTLKFPFFRIVRYHHYIIMLLQGNISSLQVLTEFQESITVFKDLLHICNGSAGFSTVQMTLMKIDIAYKQALAALKFGARLAPDQQLYFYSEYYIYDLIESYTNQYALEDIFMQKLMSLSNEREGAYDNLTLLRNYVLTERSITSTAKLMHMHRNSVIYRLNKIQENLAINLDDPNVRLRLMISFKVLDMINNKVSELSPLIEVEEDFPTLIE